MRHPVPALYSMGFTLLIPWSFLALLAGNSAGANNMPLKPWVPAWSQTLELFLQSLCKMGWGSCLGSEGCTPGWRCLSLITRGSWNHSFSCLKPILPVDLLILYSFSGAVDVRSKLWAITVTLAFSLFCIIIPWN